MNVDKPRDSAISKRKIYEGVKKMFNKNKVLFALCIWIMMFSLFAVSSVNAVEKKHIIMIDAGHGGKDSGIPLNDQMAEKDVTLAVALSIKKELSREKNIEVVFTRDADKKIDLEDRQDIIKKIKPDFLISLHVNAGFGKSASGFEIYYPTFTENTDDDKKTGKDDQSKLQNKFQNDSLKMAKLVQEGLNALFPRKGRGLRKADLPLTDGVSVPALSLEMGFASNPDDQKKLLSSRTQEDIAKTIAKSIKTYFR